MEALERVSLFVLLLPFAPKLKMDSASVDLALLCWVASV